jgi:tetratricopeptide (TPR) repeat protein
VGRDAEIARTLELLDEEILFLFYGVAGIGKTELAYRAIELARERPGWRDATPTLIQLQPGMTEQHLVALLRQRTGVSSNGAGPLGGHARSLAEELEPVVGALNARSRLLFLDDLHALDGAAVARVLGYLARRVRGSRVLAASRLELPVAARGVTPVVTRLAPLDDAAARRMLAHVGRRLGLAITDVDGIVRRAAGSPFFLLREAASSLADEPGAAVDRLGSTLASLPQAARGLLLRASVIAGARTSELATGNRPITEPLALLSRQFFVEATGDTVVVHDLVREAVQRLATPLELLRARRAAAQVFIRRTAAGGPDAALCAVEAAHQLCAAGEHEASLAFIVESHGLISGAGVDHLLRGTLDQLRVALPARAASIDLLLARTLVRRGHIAEAHELATRVSSEPQIAGSLRYLALAGTIASQRGDLRAAESYLQRAHDAAAPGTTERARVALHLADVLSLRGETSRARAILAAVRPLCEELGSRTMLRWGWSEGLSWVLDEEFARAIAAVASLRERAAALGASDLAAQLTMLEVLSRTELHDSAGARALIDQIVAPAARDSALRAPVASFYMGIAAWAEGDLRAAEGALRESWAFLQAHHSEILGLIVGHYLARVHLALGDIAAAVEHFAQSTRRATELGLDGIRSLGEAYHAHALVAAGELPAARELAERALAATPAPGRGPQAHIRMLAHQVLALAAAYAGELADARAHVERALACAGADLGPRCDTLLVGAEVELCGGDLAAVVQLAGAARDHYTERGRRSSEARACVVLASGHVALGGPGDIAMATEALGRASTLAVSQGYEALRLRALLATAAVLCRIGDRAGAEQLLSDALAHGASRPAGLELMLGSALGSRRDHELPAGLAAQLALMGLSSAPPPHAELLVDLANATITARHTVVKGRPIACALLACLIDAHGQAVPADVLYRTVWRSGEYHPLRHRNTLYVAIKRLRQILAELCPSHRGELIETVPSGWRLATGVAARQTT